MLTKHSSTQRDQLEMVVLDQLLPEDHLVQDHYLCDISSNLISVKWEIIEN